HACLYRVSPGRKAVIATVGDSGVEAALALGEAGVSVVAVVDARREGPAEELVGRLERARIPLLRGRGVARALGRRRVEGAVLGALDDSGNWTGGDESRIECD